ncbi:uncharacterized protein LOC110906451 [Helianthus annuus]|uniref:uncharacterized protein LOC110906451 n=1 Tax=Helianthus annuus TaxID=4232 RepID=UPI001653102D|nr:uncharacterized protein LOC110906451 [Helianthus annuus]
MYWYSRLEGEKIKCNGCGPQDAILRQRLEKYRQKIASDYQRIFRDPYTLNPKIFFQLTFLEAFKAKGKDLVKHFDAWARNTDSSISRLNTGNGYGVSLDDIGMKATLDKLMEDYISLISRVLFQIPSSQETPQESTRTPTPLAAVQQTLVATNKVTDEPRSTPQPLSLEPSGSKSSTKARAQVQARNDKPGTGTSRKNKLDHYAPRMKVEELDNIFKRCSFNSLKY